MRMRVVFESIIRDEEGTEASWELSVMGHLSFHLPVRRRESRDSFEAI